MKKICDLAHCSESVLGIILQSMQQQLNGVDCGVSANVLRLQILENVLMSEK